MASIINDPHGRRRIQFIHASGQRKSVRLGKVTMRHAESIKVKIEDLVSATLSGHSASDETLRWLGTVDSRLYDKLAKVHLVRSRDNSMLGAFIDAYVERRSDVKDSTRKVYQTVRKRLIDYFGVNRRLRDITPVDAEAWRTRLLEQGLADNTVRRSTGIARQWFKSAMRARLISENPFDGLAAVVRGRPERFYFLSDGDAQRVLDACPDSQWRLLFALARYGGLRIPSEALALRWQDIDWGRGRFIVTSSKTEHHEGKGTRVVPIFPELLPHLQAAFEEAAPGSTFCITKYRSAAQNLRTRLTRIIMKAGLLPWPKLWQNLRSTRQTELMDQFPAHVVSAWIGNSIPVAIEHYLQVTDDHFSRAATGATPSRKVTQKAAQQPHESPRNEPQPAPEANSTLDSIASDCSDLRKETAPHELLGSCSSGPYRTRTCDLIHVNGSGVFRRSP
jgi:integrase